MPAYQLRVGVAIACPDPDDQLGVDVICADRRSDLCSNSLNTRSTPPTRDRFRPAWKMKMSSYWLHVRFAAAGQHGAMRFASRRLVLAAAIALPLAAALGSFALTDDAPPPNVPPHVRVGESAVPTEPSPPTSTPPTTTGPPTPTKRPPATAEVVPPPPPVEDDGGDDDDSDDGADDDD
jgi:hypothetical protein